MSDTQETMATAVAKLEEALQALKSDVSSKLASLAQQLQQASANQDFSSINAVTTEIQAFQAQLDAGSASTSSLSPAANQP